MPSHELLELVVEEEEIEADRVVVGAIFKGFLKEASTL
jgi:hypothetical protein